LSALQSLGADVVAVDPAELIGAQLTVTMAFILTVWGEDGSMRALQTSGIPYTGSGVLGQPQPWIKSAASMWQALACDSGLTTLQRQRLGT
jgi:hypothetical protein